MEATRKFPSNPKMAIGFNNEMPIEDIYIGEANVRAKDVAKGLDELTASVKLWGVLQPVSVFQRDGRYELFIGQRRYFAAVEAKLKTIPAIIWPPMSKFDAQIMSMSENIQRRALNPDDTAEVCYQLYQKEKSIGKVADLLGVSVPTVSKYLGYKTVPDWLKELITAKVITLPKAVQLWNFSQHDEARARSLAERMASMTKAEVERLLILYEANPKEGVDQLCEKARKQKVLKRVIIHLPARYATGLSNAAVDMDREPEDIARRAVMDWLEDNGYA